MKGISIKAVLTMWYTLAMLLITALVVLILVFFSVGRVVVGSNENLIKRVSDNLDEIEIEKGRFDFSDLDLYKHGVLTLVLTEDGEHIVGKYPDTFPDNIPFLHGTLQTVEGNERDWLVYDLYKEFGTAGNVYVRGIIYSDYENGRMSGFIIAALAILPVLAFLSSVIGYLIARRAFKPVAKIAKAASTIGEANDLSGRIALKGKKDELKFLADTFDDMLERLEAAFIREKNFTSDASHELRTPTSVIMSEAEYALKNLDDKGEVKDSLEAILRQTKKMSVMIGELLSLARGDSDKYVLCIEQFDFVELCKMVIAEMENEANKKSISISLDSPMSGVIEADKSIIMRVLINLISNAIKYGKESGYIKISVSMHNDELDVSVSDNGEGIPKEQLDMIWERFYRVNTSRTSDEDNSLGLGLSMVKWIIEAHNGSIKAESILNVGSDFHFRLPIKYMK